MSRDGQFRLRLVCGGLWIVALTTGFFAFVPFQSVRSHLDRFAGDGSADPYSPDLHRRLQIAWGAVSVILLAGGVATAFRRSTKSGDARSDAAANLRERFVISRRRCRAAWRSSAGWLVGLTVLAAAVRAPYLKQPVRHDEAYSYNMYARLPWFVGISYYDEPNNHLLNTLGMHVGTSLFGDSLVALRLTAFLAGCLMPAVAFLAARSLGGRPAGIVAGMLVAVSSALIEYSTNARGYTLVGLFTLLAIHQAAIARRNAAGRRKPGCEWGALAAASALGLFSIPVMLYPLAMIWTWLLVAGLSGCGCGRRRFVARWVFHGLATAGLAGVLYAPALLVSGFGKIVANPYVRSLSFDEMLKRLPSGLRETWGLLGRDWPLPALAIVAVGIVGAFVGRGRRGRPAVALLAATLAFVAVMAVQRVVPPPRILLFLVPVSSVVSATGLAGLWRRLGERRKRIAAAVFLVVCGAWPLIAAWQADSVLRSEETGVFPEAAQVLNDLELPNLPESERPLIVTIYPVSSPLVYTARQRGFDMRRFEFPDERTIRNAVLIVTQSYDQDVDEVLKGLGLDQLASADEFEPFREYPTVTLYRMKPKE